MQLMFGGFGDTRERPGSNNTAIYKQTATTGQRYKIDNVTLTGGLVVATYVATACLTSVLSWLMAGLFLLVVHGDTSVVCCARSVISAVAAAAVAVMRQYVRSRQQCVLVLVDVYHVI